jgi:phage terminase small subunit
LELSGGPIYFDGMSRDLDFMEQKFLTHYLDTGNATEAAVLAGYDLPSRRAAQLKGSQLLSRKHIQDEIQAHLSTLRERYEASRENIISEIAKIAFSDVRDLFVIDKIRDPETDEVKEERLRVDLTRLDAITARAIAEIRHDAHGRPIIKMHSKLGALEMLAKIQKMLVDRVEVDDVRDPIQRIREARRRAQAAIQDGRSIWDGEETGETIEHLPRSEAERGAGTEEGEQGDAMD